MTTQNLVTRALAIGAVALQLTACGGDRTPTAANGEPSAGAQGGVAPAAAGSTTTASAQSADGATTVMQTGPDVTVALPDGIAVYPGAQATMTMAGSGPDGQGGMSTFETKDSAADVIAFYKREFDRTGYAIETDMNVSGIRSLAGRKNEKSTFLVQATERPGGGAAIQVITGTEQ